MPTAYPYIVITDGTDTVTMHDGSSPASLTYPIVKWTPAVASRRTSSIASGLPYEDVTETMTINVYGSTTAECLSRVQTLKRLLDKAERWAREDDLTQAPVILKYWPQGSALSETLQAVILGRAADDASMTLPDDWHNGTGISKVAIELTITFRRRGLWITATATHATAVNTDISDVATLTFASSVTTPSPVNLGVYGFSPGTISDGFLFTSKGTTQLMVMSPGSASFASGTAAWSTVVETSKASRDGTLMRYTPSGTATSYSPVYTATAIRGLRLAFFAVVRNNDATKTYQMSVTCTRYGVTMGAMSATTNTVTIDGSSTSPRCIYVGQVSMPPYVPTSYLSSYATRFRFNVTASASGGTLDIDHVVILSLDDEDTSRVLAFNTSWTATASYPEDVNTLYVRPLLLTHQRAGVWLEDWSITDAQLPLTYRGDPYIMTTGSTLCAVTVMPYGTTWCYTGGIASTVPLSIYYTVQRYPAYITPE